MSLKTKLMLIQVNLAPYRIPLFERLDSADDLDFTLVLMARNKPTYPTWKYDFEQLPFRTKVLSGLCVTLPTRGQVCVNLPLLYFLYRERPDVIVCCGYSASTLLVAAYAAITRMPFVIWMEGNAITEAQRGLAGIRTRLRRLLSRHASGFVVAGTKSQEYVNSLLPPRCKRPMLTAYNCVDSEAFAASIARLRADERAWRAFRGQYPRLNLLFSGRLVPIKGISLLLDTYERVIQRMPEPVGLIMLGDGPLSTEVEQRKAARGLTHLHLEGFIGPDHYPHFFAAADVFVLMSLLDCNPLVVFEALAAGLPVVCSDRVGNATDFIIPGVNGNIVDPHDVDAAADSIVSLLVSTRRAEMSQASRQIVEKANYDSAAAAFRSITATVAAARVTGHE